VQAKKIERILSLQTATKKRKKAKKMRRSVAQKYRTLSLGVDHGNSRCNAV
jgi:hypothetical protein